MRLYLILPILLMFSCATTNSVPVESTSPGGTKTIKVNAAGGAMFDPLKVTLEASEGDKSVPVTFEFYNDHTGPDNVRIIWENENKALVTLEQQDKTFRSFQVSFSEQGIRLSELK